MKHQPWDLDQTWPVGRKWCQFTNASEKFWGPLPQMWGTKNIQFMTTFWRLPYLLKTCYHHHHLRIYSLPITKSTKCMSTVSGKYKCWHEKQLQLLLKFCWVCHGTQVFRQCVPCRGTCVRESTFTELCVQPWQCDVRWWCWLKARTCPASTSGLYNDRQIRWTRPVENTVHWHNSAWTWRHKTRNISLTIIFQLNLC